MSVRVLTLFDLEPVVQPDPPAAKSKPAQTGGQEAIQSEPDTRIPEPKKEKTAALRKPVQKTTEAKAPVDKNYYSIGETAKMFDVRTSHIRFWTVQFALKMRTNRKGDRLYTPENIEQLKVIHHLVKEQGFTIAGAKAKLKELKGVKVEELKKSNLVDVVRALKEKLLALRQLI